MVAAAAFPAVAMSGLVAKTSADSFEKLPVELKFLPPPEMSYLYAKDGSGKDVLLTQFFEENRRNIPLPQMGKLVPQAIVAAEDSRFYQHHGVDLKGVARSLVANRSAGEVQQGASTLTMQYVRQALTYSAKTPEEIKAVTDDTAARKLREMRYAMALEKELPKEKILENYLNIAYYGHNAYGIFAASYTYFSKHPQNLTLPEAAMLAGLVQAPSAYDPVKNDKDAAKERRDYVIGRMAHMKYVSQADADQARQLPITLNNNGAFSNECVSATRDTGFFCDYFKDWWKRQETLGKDANEREDRLRRGGYKIYTTLDLDAHQAAVREAAKLESVNSPYALGMAVVEPGTGRVKSLAVNRKYSTNQTKNGPHSDPKLRKQGVKSNYPNTVNPLLGGGSLPGYQAGSTFKMFTMIAALEAGLPLTYQLYSPYRYETNFKTPGDGCNDHWCPKNHGQSVQGNYNMYGAFGFSVNTYFAQLIQQVRPAKVLDVTKRLGLEYRQKEELKRLNNPGQLNQMGSFTLGVTDNTPLEMANAYATLAADGMYCEPLPVVQILDVKGQKVQGVADPKCEQRIRKDIAEAATDAARCPVADKPLGGACGAPSTAGDVGRAIEHPFAGKTGTTDSNRSAWFIGFTRNLAGAAFIADPDYRPHEVTNAQHDKPKKLFASALRKAIDKLPRRDFAKPPPGMINGDMRAVPNVVCNAVDKASSDLTAAGFDPYVVPDRVNSRCREGTVARVEPGRKAPKGSQVSLYVSNGIAPPPPSPTTGPSLPGRPPGCKPPRCRPGWPPGDNDVLPGG